jgi:mannitol-specific phosphotransferase system IIBC component
MDEEVEKEEADRAWEEKRAKAREEEEEKVRKNREKREKAKARKAKKGKGVGSGMDGGEGASLNGEAVVKKRLGPAKIATAPVHGEDAAQGAGGDVAPSTEEKGITIHEDD